MTRWEWDWAETETQSGSGAHTALGGAAAARRRARLALTVAGLAATIVVGAVLVVSALSSAALHASRSTSARPLGALSFVPLHRASPAGWEGRAIDAVLRRQAVVFQGGRHGHEVALTFDDGPGPYTPALVAQLRRLRVRATFFPIGAMERYFSPATRTEHRLGEVIGDHTETHPLMARLPVSRQRDEIIGQAQWMSALGVPYPRLFRPPYGSYDATTLTVLRPLHMLLVLWSTDTQDYTRPGVAAIVRRALSGARPGAIILMHDGGGNRSETVAALPLIVRGLRRRGLRPVSLPRLLRDDPPAPGERLPRLAGG